MALDNGEIIHLPNKRIEELLSIIEESSGKAIIWANYRHDIEAIKLALSKEYGMKSVGTYYGDTDADERIGDVAIHSGLTVAIATRSRQVEPTSFPEDPAGTGPG